MIQKTYSLWDWELTGTDTIIHFDQTTDIVHHRICNDGITPHSLIAVRTADYSHLYYYGPSTLLDIEDDNLEIPKELRLSVYPNPFNPSTNIQYYLPEMTDVRIVVYDIRGKRIWNHEEFSKPSNSYSIEWSGLDENGQPMASGVYLINVETTNYHEVQKAVLVR